MRLFGFVLFFPALVTGGSLRRNLNSVSTRKLGETTEMHPYWAHTPVAGTYSLIVTDSSTGNQMSGANGNVLTPCTIESDCSSREYCSSGVCRAFGTCQVIEDCKNLFNEYEYCNSVQEVQCIGGRCGSSCCKTDSDCLSENEYCSSGSCREVGSCSSDVDCKNPSNTYPTLSCIGYVRCTAEGQCGKKCSNSSCPPGLPTAICNHRPCDATTCAGSVRCIDDYCGGCKALNFDSAGYEVCT